MLELDQQLAVPSEVLETKHWASQKETPDTTYCMPFNERTHHHLSFARGNNPESDQVSRDSYQFQELCKCTKRSAKSRLQVTVQVDSRASTDKL